MTPHTKHLRHASSTLVLTSWMRYKCLLWCTVSGAACCWPRAVFHKILDVVDIRAHVFYKHVPKKKITQHDVFLQLDEELSAKHLYKMRTCLTNISNTATCLLKMHRMKMDKATCNNVITLAPNIVCGLMLNRQNTLLNPKSKIITTRCFRFNFNMWRRRSVEEMLK